MFIFWGRQIVKTSVKTVEQVPALPQHSHVWELLLEQSGDGDLYSFKILPLSIISIKCFSFLISQ